MSQSSIASTTSRIARNSSAASRSAGSRPRRRGYREHVRLGVLVVAMALLCAAARDDDVHWAGLEQELADVVPPMFVEGDPEEPSVDAYDVERERVTLADVGGLADVKERLEVAFLAPLRSPELRKLYRKDLRGGL